MKADSTVARKVASSVDWKVVEKAARLVDAAVVDSEPMKVFF